MHCWQWLILLWIWSCVAGCPVVKRPPSWTQIQTPGTSLSVPAPRQGCHSRKQSPETFFTSHGDKMCYSYLSVIFIFDFCKFFIPIWSTSICPLSQSCHQVTLVLNEFTLNNSPDLQTTTPSYVEDPWLAGDWLPSCPFSAVLRWWRGAFPGTCP